MRNLERWLVKPGGLGGQTYKPINAADEGCVAPHTPGQGGGHQEAGHCSDICCSPELAIPDVCILAAERRIGPGCCRSHVEVVQARGQDHARYCSWNTDSQSPGSRIRINACGSRELWRQGTCYGLPTALLNACANTTTCFHLLAPDLTSPYWISSRRRHIRWRGK